MLPWLSDLPLHHHSSAAIVKSSQCPSACHKFRLGPHSAPAALCSAAMSSAAELALKKKYALLQKRKQAGCWL